VKRTEPGCGSPSTGDLSQCGAASLGGLASDVRASIGAYVASKYAPIGYSDILRAELAGDGVGRF
jgi:hypothetical protein